MIVKSKREENPNYRYRNLIKSESNPKRCLGTRDVLSSLSLTSHTTWRGCNLKYWLITVIGVLLSKHQSGGSDSEQSNYVRITNWCGSNSVTQLNC